MINNTREIVMQLVEEYRAAEKESYVTWKACDLLS